MVPSSMVTTIEKLGDKGKSRLCVISEGQPDEQGLPLVVRRGRVGIWNLQTKYKYKNCGLPSPPLLAGAVTGSIQW
jgi:hypothetical protein